MKALILAGGRGKRLDDLSVKRNKCMIPINGKYAVEYSLDNAIDAGITDILLVVGYRAEEIVNHYGNRYRDCRLRYVIQWEQNGLVHALESARAAVDGEDFMLLLGDEIMLNPRHKQMLSRFAAGTDFATCGTLPVEDLQFIRRTYTFVKDGEDRIFRLVEKPRKPLNEWMGTGVCLFRNAIFDYVAVTPIHHERGEKELPDLIQCAIDDAKVVRSFRICDRYTNINTREDIEVAEGFFR